MQNLLVLGSVNMDHMIQIPRPIRSGETLLGSHYRCDLGGKGANQAVAAARLSQTTSVTFIACVGEDEVGKSVQQQLRQESINVDNVRTIAHCATGVAMIQVLPSGKNNICIAPGANAHLTSTLIENSKALIENADGLLIQLETPISSVIRAVKIAKQSQTIKVLNPAPAQYLPVDMLSDIDMITPNETEAEILTNISISDSRSAQQSAGVLHEMGVARVVITLGERGVWFSDEGQGEHIPSFLVKAIDTTAAGDTFNAALSIKLLEGATMQSAILFANAAAAISVTRVGALSSIPHRKEVELFLAKQG